MYKTTNSVYGQGWQTANVFAASFSHSKPYQAVTNTRAVNPQQILKDQQSLALVHDPEHPCGIMSMSNVPVKTKHDEVQGEFTNTRRDFYSDRQGLWSNAMHNTDGATIDNARGTYSNLQGVWSRLGPSTYAASHGKGEWVQKWTTLSTEPTTLNSLYDQNNPDPRDVIIPFEDMPQNMQSSNYST